MKFNQRLKNEIAQYREYAIIVEGKNDVLSLYSLGFEKVFQIHQTGVPIREVVEQISSTLGKKDKVCILTDLDKKGKQLYKLLKTLFQEQGIKLDSSLRALLIRAQVSHIEGLASFMEKVDQIE